MTTLADVVVPPAPEPLPQGPSCVHADCEAPVAGDPRAVLVHVAPEVWVCGGCRAAAASAALFDIDTWSPIPMANVNPRTGLPEPEPQRCPSCDCPINPFTGECRGCSD